jgi:hypothetical protein
MAAWRWHLGLGVGFTALALVMTWPLGSPGARLLPDMNDAFFNEPEDLVGIRSSSKGVGKRRLLVNSRRLLLRQHQVDRHVGRAEISLDQFGGNSQRLADVIETISIRVLGQHCGDFGPHLK